MNRKYHLIKGLTCLALAIGTQSFAHKQRSFLASSSRNSRQGTMCLNSKDSESLSDETSSFKVQTWNPIRLLVLRLGLTEPMATSPLNYGKYDGTFTCAYCDATLFDSNSKYDSGSGWPSFWRTVAEDAISYKMEFDGRLECKCKKCSSHLGHVFLDGPRPGSVPDDLLLSSPASDPRSKSGSNLPRFCINGAALRFQDRIGDNGESSTSS